MSFDIDMENYGRNSAPAATEPQVVDTNSYQQEDGEFPVVQELLDQPVKNQVDSASAKQELNPQELNFRALREEIDRMKAEKEYQRQEHQLQLEMLRANLNKREQPQPEVRPKKFFDGMEGRDVPNVDEFNSAFERWQAESNERWREQERIYQQKIEELQVQQQHPDYAEVIEKFALPLVKQKPHLLQGLQGAENKALFAYELGKMAQSMQSQQMVTQKSDNAQRIVENSRKPGTLSQAGGQAALSKADYFASMSDAEFMKMASRNLEGI